MSYCGLGPKDAPNRQDSEPDRYPLETGSRLSCELSKEREASEPLEARGLSRDAVRMLVAGMRDGSLIDCTFNVLPALHARGDLLVIRHAGAVLTTTAVGLTVSLC